VVHKVADALAPEVASWTSTCGWKFAAGSNAAFETSTVQSARFHKSVCEKCLPAEKEALRVSLRALAGRQGGE
jgi:hypothetical protein